MGNKGSKVQDIESKFDVKIKFPDRNARGRSIVLYSLLMKLL